MTQEIDVPADMAFLARLIEQAEAGMVTYLTREGQRVAVVVPADVVEAIRRLVAEAEDDKLAVSADESRRRLEQLAREQRVQAVEDLADLRGPAMAEEEFKAFHAAAVSEQSQ